VSPLGAPRFEFDVRRFSLLLSVADFVSSRLDAGELFRKFSPLLRSLVPIDFINLALFDPEREAMKMRFWEEGDWQSESIQMAVEQTAVGWVWRNQTVLYLDDLLSPESMELGLRWLRQRGTQSYCVFPLTSVARKLGAVGYGSKQTRAFAPEDIQFLQCVTELLAIGMDSSLSKERFAEERSRLRMLIEIGDPSLRGRNLPQAVDSILKSMQKWAPQDNFGIYLYDPNSGSLRLLMADPTLPERIAPGGGTPIEGTLAGQAFRTRRKVILDESALSVLSFPSVKRWMELGVKSVYLAPLISAGGRLGVLKVSRRDGRPFSPGDVETLERVAASIMPILERNAGDKKGRDEARLAPGDEKLADAGAALTDASQQRGLAKLRVSEILEAANLFSSASPEALIKSENLLSAYFNASQVGLCILDDHFRYLAVNDTLAAMNGIPAAEHLGKTVRELLGDFAELIEPQFERVLITGQPVLDLEISSVIPTRTEPGHWHEHYIPIKDAAGKVMQIGVVVVETTEKKKLEESLQGVSEKLRQEKKRQQVMAEVSRVLSAKLDVKHAFPQISARLRRVLHQEYAALAVREEKSGNLVRQALDFPLRKGPPGENEIPVARNPQGRALLERVPLILTQQQMQAFPPGAADQLLAEGLKSLCCVPLLRPAGPLGVLVLGSTRADAFKTDDLVLLNQVAAQLAIAMENAQTGEEIKRFKDRLQREKSYLEGDSDTHPGFEEIIGESPILKRVLAQIAIVAHSDATVLISGETGTGKGLVARAIHRISRRRERYLVTLNCAAIPTGLVESELFGHEKGAFTGAVKQKIGRLELADKGTLFLDEIGEIPLELQPKLLRVLQDREFERLGGTRTIKVDLRLISATNRNLAKSVADKQFRSDLFYRLNVFPIRVPALREHPEDIPLLVRYFVRKFAGEMNRTIETIPSATMEALIRWPWPGNVRELENFIERSVILTEGTALRVPLAELAAERPAGVEQHTLKNTEREHIIQVLRETRGVLSGRNGAAQRLGLKRTTLQSKMQRLGITREDYFDQEIE